MHETGRRQDQTAKKLERWLRRVGGGAEVLAGLADLLADEAVFVVDAERHVLLWSAGAERLLGFSAADVEGEHCLKSNRCAQCMRGCGIAKHGRIDDSPLHLFDAAGRAVALRKSARAFFDADGRFAGGIEVLRRDDAPSDTPAPARLAPFHDLVSGHPSMQGVFDTIRNVAETDTTVLVRGESGTGKELVAQALHAESHRAAGPFIPVNCAALTATLLESELFGHVRGAFTGAVSDRPGLFARAHGGTLFLDEVAELPPELQAKLLRVLEERSVIPVGGTEPQPIDVRVVSATHRSLRERVQAGRFREDLMYRLRVVPLFLPPLRERRGDVELLLRHFIGTYNDKGPRRVTSVAPEAMRALLDHDWPGNVRELRNVVEYAFAVGRGPEILLAELPPELRGDPSPSPAAPPPAVSSERDRILAALEATGGHLGRAAEMLGMSRPTLWRRRKKYGL